MAHTFYVAEHTVEPKDRLYYEVAHRSESVDYLPCIITYKPIKLSKGVL